MADPIANQESFCHLNLKQRTGNNSEIGPGNFNLLSFADSSSADDLKKFFAGGFDDCDAINAKEPPTIDTKTGSATGPVAQGINTRFKIYGGGLSEDDFSPDCETADTPGGIHRGTCGASGYCDYLEGYPAASSCPPDSDKRFHRRIVGVPVVKCDGTENGDGEVEVLGIICILFTESIPPGQKEVYAEVLPDEDCSLSGIPTGTLNLAMSPLSVEF